MLIRTRELIYQTPSKPSGCLVLGQRPEHRQWSPTVTFCANHRLIYVTPLSHKTEHLTDNLSTNKCCPTSLSYKNSPSCRQSELQKIHRFLHEQVKTKEKNFSTSPKSSMIFQFGHTAIDMLDHHIDAKGISTLDSR